MPHHLTMDTPKSDSIVGLRGPPYPSSTHRSLNPIFLVLPPASPPNDRIRIRRWNQKVDDGYAKNSTMESAARSVTKLVIQIVTQTTPTLVSIDGYGDYIYRPLLRPHPANDGYGQIRIRLHVPPASSPVLYPLVTNSYPSGPTPHLATR